MGKGPVLTAAAKKKIAELEKENALLREALSLDDVPFTIETWEQSGTQEMRDGFAARALMQEWGHQARALQRLGFAAINSAGQWKPAVVASIAQKVLNTDGVRALLDHNLADTEGSWAKIVERQRRIALTGADEHALKAAQNLARFENRVQDKPAAPATVSLHVLVNGATGATSAKQVETIEHDPLAILSHEPSDVGGRIDTGDKLADSAVS